MDKRTGCPSAPSCSACLSSFEAIAGSIKLETFSVKLAPSRRTDGTAPFGELGGDGDVEAGHQGKMVGGYPRELATVRARPVAGELRIPVDAVEREEREQRRMGAHPRRLLARQLLPERAGDGAAV